MNSQTQAKNVVASPKHPIPDAKEAPMLDQEMFQAVKALRDKGWKKKAIARELGLDPKTVRKYVRLDQHPGPRSAGRPSILAPFFEQLKRRMPEVNYHAAVLYQELKEHGFVGSYKRVQEWVRPFRQAQRRVVEATVRFETGPGQQAQVDWGTVRVTLGGVELRVQLFAQVLGFSRRLFVRAALDQTLPTLIRCHEAAFAHFGGLTVTQLYDNMKTVVLKRDGDGQHIVWHPLFKDFADYWGFTPRLCRFYRAQTKGKIESGVKYVKRNFFALRGTTFHSLEQLNDELFRWALEIADTRLHGTTHERPIDRFAREALRPLPTQAAYQLETLLTRTVPHDALVVFRTNRYSVPWTSVGRQVTLVEAGEHVKIFDGATLLAEHPRRTGRFEQVVLPTHFAGLWPRPAPAPVSLGASRPDEDVQIRDLSLYEAVASGWAS